jgi:selenocysteine lyase/cysteine desulfurase
MPLALQGVRPDFLVAAGYKWLLCPYGVGLMFVSGAWRDARPLEESWMARVGADDFAALVQSSDDYMPGARRFDVGEKCTAQLPGAIAALEQIRAWGVEEIGETLAAVNARLAARLEALGFALPPASARCPHLFGARLRKGFDGDLAGELAKRRVYVSRRGDLIRFAPHLHVDDDDVTRLEATLAEILGAG